MSIADKEAAGAYLEQLMQLLQREKEADLEGFRQKVLDQPLEKRRAEGFCWYPLELIRSGYTYGDRAFVEVRRTKKLEVEHRFRSGNPVSLFTEQPEVRRKSFSGVVYFVKEDRMRIVLNSADLPDWLGLGRVGVDLQFDETTYQEMEKALQAVRQARRDRLAEIRDIFAGLIPLEGKTGAPRLGHPLNASQQEAVAGAIGPEPVALIHGPPGTGKTTTLVQAVRELVEVERAVLVAAPSNAAADLLTERLAAAGLAVVRVGNISRVDEAVIRHTLEVLFSAHPEQKPIKKLKKDAAEKRKAARRHKRRFGPQERTQRRNLHREASELQAWARQLEDRLLQQILDGAQVITCTLVGSANAVLDQQRFRTVLIDEAAQALEPATWIPIRKASRVVLAGDPFQLPPTLKSTETAREGLNITLLERGLRLGLPNHLLRIQYRMHRTIMGFSNHRFYGDQLVADSTVADRSYTGLPYRPLLFIDTVGCGFEEAQNPRNRSRFNPGEIDLLREYLIQLQACLPGEEPGSMAVISPYREQVELLETALADREAMTDWLLQVQTIDGFQGQEADIVCISLVRSNSKGELGFLKDHRRMNVALTRARKLLVVIGDSGTLAHDPFYLDFLEFVEKNGTYQTAWEYLQHAGSW